MSSVSLLLTRDTAHLRARSWGDAAAWIDERTTQGKAARTLDSDERIMAALVNAFPGHGLEDFTRDDLMRFFADVTPAQRNKYRSHVATFFRWCVLTDRLDANPMDKVPGFAKPKQKIISVYSDAEIELLCSLSPLYRLLFDTGVRFSEARALQAKHVILRMPELDVETGELLTPEASVLTVFKGKGNKDRIIPLTKRLTQALSWWLTTDALRPNDHLWGTKPGGHTVRRRDPIGETALQAWHRNMQLEAGVPYRNFHTTRHTFATYYLRRGVSMLAVSKMLGHASIKTTMDLYAHLMVDDFAAELAALGV